MILLLKINGASIQRNSSTREALFEIINRLVHLVAGEQLSALLQVIED